MDPNQPLYIHYQDFIVLYLVKPPLPTLHVRQLPSKKQTSYISHQNFTPIMRNLQNQVLKLPSL